MYSRKMITALIVLNTITTLIIVYMVLLLRQSFSSNRQLISYLKHDDEFKKCVADTNIWYIQSIKYILIAMCRYIDCIKHEAIKEERYEDAKRCQEAIKEMNKLINA